MRSTMIKRLDALELKAAAEKARQDADDPDAVAITWSGLLGYVFGLAEAGLLDYSGDVPAALPGYMPFDVEYTIGIPGTPRQRVYTMSREVTRGGAAVWSRVLAGGLWRRLHPPCHSYPEEFGGLGHPLAGHNARRWGWHIIDDACHPERATALGQLIEYCVTYGTGRKPWLIPFREAQGSARADDPRLIAVAMNCLFHAYEGGEWIANRCYTAYERLERGEPVDLAQFDH
jgi:hypothetical protein